MLGILFGFVIDILVALALAGCVFGLALAMERRPRFLRVAGWTALAMAAIGTYGEWELAASIGETPDVLQVLPLMLLAGVAFWLSRRYGTPTSGPALREAGMAELESVEAELAG
jgi:hypothetical protein